MRPRLADNYRLPASEEENGDRINGPRCLMSDLPVDMCGLRCHRNSNPLPVVDHLRDAA